MANYTGYLLGKVQLNGAIRSQVLANLVETLISKYQDSSKKLFKFNENHRYSVECSERGLRLTSPGYRSKDEGFESDCDSIRSIRITELDISDLIQSLDITPSCSGSNKNEKETEGPSSPGGGSMDSTILTSSSDDNNSSSSGNGSDSDEFIGASSSEGRNGSTIPMWEILPNLSSFQSYPIEDVVFCHSDTFHPSTLVWVVRHLEKMIALVTAFRTRTEAEELFQTYRELRVKLKPVKCKLNFGLKPGDGFRSLNKLPVYPTAILRESTTNLFTNDTRSLLDFGYGGTKLSLSRAGSNSLSQHNYMYISNPNIIRFGLDENSSGGDEGFLQEHGNNNNEDNHHHTEDEDSPLLIVPQRPQRRQGPNNQKKEREKDTNKPMLLVPLKTETTLSSQKTHYPKESYLYHVMGRSISTSTFAPYQRNLNFYTDYSSSQSGQHLLVPFSSWVELSSNDQFPKGFTIRKHYANKTKSKVSSSLGNLGGAKGTTSKILLRDVNGRDSMWASLSQRFKRNVRETLIPKLNGMFPNVNPSSSSSSGDGNGRSKKRASKKVTFNAWATVQMV